ncbi:hypothetical protein DFP74_2337 [Nocardiopsis sp. Huas11]|uniref:hypothetical protein n=1 Tax=Nocardiopsis sp. Huas11 TaxID=2183912 RepID=UPI000EB14572|nr:hypothetical protein [Nocardiopsis sp. Huas11]RKS06694.1 hypothetical protein DFP74_2337 [Nocardiopsis sp. Huas11]
MTEEQKTGAKKVTAHSNCEHPPTKAARAKCRRAKGKITVQQSAGATVEAKPAPEPTVEKSDEVLDAVADVDRVTRENWRDFKNARVTIHIYNRMPVKNAIIQGWGAKFFDYLIQGADKSTRVPAAEVERVLLLND